jgi:hypothetical protein
VTVFHQVDCRTCKSSLVVVAEATVPAARNSHDGLSWVHHDGWDSDTLEIRQRDAGHVPIVRKGKVHV